MRRERVDVAHATVDDETDDAARFGARREHLAPVAARRFVAHAHDEHRTGRRLGDRDVHAQVVAGRAHDGERGAAHARARPDRPDARRHRLPAALAERGGTQGGEGRGEIVGHALIVDASRTVGQCRTRAGPSNATLEELSPFELKARLIEIAADGARGTGHADARRRARQPELDRDHAPRRVLPARAVRARRVGAHVGGTRPRRHARTRRHRRPPRPVPRRATRRRRRRPARARTVDYGASLGFDADEFVYELADGIIGDHYPGPDRICVHAERILREYLADELCQGEPPDGIWNLFAVEGGTAAICYIFDSLANNLLLRPGDTHRADGPRVHAVPRAAAPRALRPRRRRRCARARSTRTTTRRGSSPTPRSTSSPIPRCARMFVVNPSNPPSVMLAPATLARIATSSSEHNPDLIVVTDDVYGTFVPEFVSLMDVVPVEHDRGVLVLEVLRRDRLAARRRSRSTRTTCSTRRLARDDRGRARRARPALRVDQHRRPPTSRSSTAWSPTAARSRSTTPPGCRCPSRCR